MTLFNSKKPIKMRRFVCLFVLSQVFLDNVAAQIHCSPIDFASSDDIPECTFGCYCVRGRVSLYGWFRSNTVCRYPECDGVVECAHPTISCGCPICDGRQDCVVIDGNGQEVTIDAGQPQQVGCAICECNPADPAVPFPESPDGSISTQQRRCVRNSIIPLSDI
ncbi:uncharacterized protein LOC117109471 [Anneissia japonica]|uniref:uncharacterized protein LOC117109471 n=1 Tax=Anneissia japonica TaxID=1529436 RepID=UPI001425A472|nr:uncharacterized protein LOC117109471 [Anneissia japonica]